MTHHTETIKAGDKWQRVFDNKDYVVIMPNYAGLVVLEKVGASQDPRKPRYLVRITPEELQARWLKYL